VIAAQPNTVVVINAGTIVDVAFAADARALLHCWFGGQETANALAAVLLGRRDPGGRLPTTIPERVEHTPAFGAFPGENSEVRYGEGLLMGYRWYDTRHLPVRYPFGHGLSYTTFAIGAPRASSTTIAADEAISLEVDVTNSGTRRGHEVVQCYVGPPASSPLSRPAQALGAFAKVTLEPGETQTVTLTLGARAFAYWDPTDVGWPEREHRLRQFQPFGGLTAARRTEPGWYIDAGDHELRIGRSSRDVAHTLVVTVPATLQIR
jgi:beta-glucosidase